MPRPETGPWPDGRRGQFLALSLLSIAIFLIFLVLIMPGFDLWQTLAEEARTRQNQADGYRRLIERQSEITQNIARRRRELAQTSDYIVETDPAIAAALAQRDLRALAETSGVNVLTTLALPPTSAEGFTAVKFQMGITGPLRPLRDFIYAIEAEQPRLIVDLLVLRPEAASPAEAENPSYEMTLELHGYMLQEPAQ